jgi:hypothetical protein
MWVGGHELNRSGTFADPAGAVMYLVSRPFLESHVRRRVRAIDNVVVTDGHDVVEPIGGPNQVTGVRAVNRDTGAQQVFDTSWWSTRWAEGRAHRRSSTTGVTGGQSRTGL